MLETRIVFISKDSCPDTVFLSLCTYTGRFDNTFSSAAQSLLERAYISAKSKVVRSGALPLAKIVELDLADGQT